MKINEQVRMLEIPALSTMGQPTTIYPMLLIGEDDCLLVDAGYPGQAEAFLDAIKHEGLLPRQITGLLITHHDIDHIGSAAALKKRIQDARIISHTLDKPFIQGDQKPLKLAAFEMEMIDKPEEERQFLYKITRAFEQSYLPVDETVQDGQTLNIAGGITVIHSPGHTPGHLCLYIPAIKCLIAADALRVFDGKLGLMVDDNNADPVLFRQSIQKLTAFDVDRVVCYHGGYFEGPVNNQLRDLLAN